MSVLQPGFAQFHASDIFSDCKIICGSYQVNAHKVVLCGQSEYFMTALKSNTFKEGKSGVIELKATSDDDEQPDPCCDDPDIVKLMIEYFYYGDYLREGTSSQVHLIEHAKVFAMAIKYQVEGLRKLAARKFEDSAQKDWNHADLADAIHVVYNSTPDDIPEQREIVADVINAHFYTLHESEQIRAVVGSIASLAYGLLERSRKSLGSVYVHEHDTNFRQECKGCTTAFDYCRNCFGSRGGYGGLVKFRGNCPFCGHSHT